MMTIEIHIDPDGDISRRHTIERIYVGNISELAPVSDYAVYDNVAPGEVPPDALVRRHHRKDGALRLSERVLRAVRQSRAGRSPGLLDRADHKPNRQVVDEVQDQRQHDESENLGHGSSVAQ